MNRYDEWLASRYDEYWIEKDDDEIDDDDCLYDWDYFDGSRDSRAANYKPTAGNSD